MWIAQTAPFRYVAAPGRCGATPPPACGALWRMAQLGKCARVTPRQPAGRLARGSANLGLSLTSRKSAFWPQRLTENRILPPAPHGKPHSAQPVGFRMCFSVTPTLQSALFRRMRLSSPAQTRCHLTEKCTLAPAPSRKGAVCMFDLTEKRTLWSTWVAECDFGDNATANCAFP